MKRDMDLCRNILLVLEECEQQGGWVDINIPEHSYEEVTFHVRLLAEAGLIDAETSPPWGAPTGRQNA